MICIKLAECLTDTASRTSGLKLRQMIVEQLQTEKSIQLDVTGAIFTPSFVDEAFGKLSQVMSYQDFKARIQFIHLKPSHQILFSRIIHRRFVAGNL